MATTSTILQAETAGRQSRALARLPKHAPKLAAFTGKPQVKARFGVVCKTVGSCKR